MDKLLLIELLEEIKDKIGFMDDEYIMAMERAIFIVEECVTE